MFVPSWAQEDSQSCNSNAIIAFPLSISYWPISLTEIFKLKLLASDGQSQSLSEKITGHGHELQLDAVVLARG